ncbi:MAG: 23S rRNA (adenine(2503)-C(2))-methyltransferase RlmN [Sphaerochaetaceae bacterium]
MKENFSLYALEPAKIVTVLSLSKNYQGRQVYEWLVKGVTDYSGMTNLPGALREALKRDFPAPLSSTVVEQQTDASGAVKLALALYDEQVVECVLLIDKEGRKTACLSSQVGCAMGCAFCRTATMGLRRNLTAPEIVEQYVHLNRVSGAISHIVFMGMGEPLANLEEVTKAIKYLNDPDGFNIGLRRITVSTCGITPAIDKLTLPVRLAVSLTTAINAQRDEVMPINRAFPLAKLKETLINYQSRYKKRITLEYVLLSGYNTTKENATALELFSRGLDVMVNLIPYNEAAELKWKTPPSSEIRVFCQELDKLKVPYTVRYSRGREIEGACGQLATKLE